MTLDTSDFDSVSVLLLPPEIDREELGKEELTAVGASSGCLEEMMLAALGALSYIRLNAVVEEEDTAIVDTVNLFESESSLLLAETTCSCDSLVAMGVKRS